MKKVVETVLLGAIPGGLWFFGMAGRLLARPCAPRPEVLGELCGLNVQEAIIASWMLMVAAAFAALWAVGEIRRLEK